MSFEEFQKSLKQHVPPADLNLLLTALWYDAKGDWAKSHAIVQDMETKDAALIHAYLHRKEGDLWNAGYWYERAGASKPNHSLEEEWKSLILTFLK